MQTNIEKILSRLQGVNQVGREHWIALCPCHDDHRPSLDIAVRNDKVLMCCPVCGADGVRVVQTLGLGARELFVQPSKPLGACTSEKQPEGFASMEKSAASKQLGLVAQAEEKPAQEKAPVASVRPPGAEYYYTDCIKKTRFYTLDERTGEWRKGFCWYHKGERGEQVRGLPKDENGRSVFVPLYHFELLREARLNKRHVYVVEGEKDVDTLLRLGCLAVCSPHGAGNGRLENKWLSEYNADFSGLDVLVLPDNDEPGQKLGQYIAEQLFPVANSVKLLDLHSEWSDLPPKGDITDIAEELMFSGEIVRRLSELADRTERWEPPKGDSPYICLSDVESTETEWLWYPYIPLGKVTLLTADPGTGKTFLALYIAAMTTRGCPFYGEERPWRDRANVVYQTAEDGLADTIKPRLEPMKPIFDNIFVFKEDERSLSLTDGEIEKTMRDLRPKLLVFDPLQAYLGANVDMHRANEIRPVLGRIAHLAEKYNCAVLFIMHHNKATQNSALHRALGSMDIPAVARSMLILANDPEGGKLMCHEKSSLAPNGKSIRFDIIPEMGGVVFYGFSELRADDVLNQKSEGRSKPSTKRDELCDKILEMFGDEETITVPSYAKLCEEFDCTLATLRRAVKELEINVRFTGYGKDRVTHWSFDEAEDIS